MTSRRTIDSAAAATMAWIQEALDGDAVLVADHIAQEEAFAQRAVEGLLRVNASELTRRSRLAGYDGILMAVHLLDWVEDSFYSAVPVCVLAVADAALAILRRCDRATPSLLFRAWKARATALCRIGQFAPALQSVERAEVIADDTRCPALYRAVVANSRLYIYCDMRATGPWDLLHAARDTFLTFRDEEHARWTQMMEGALWHRMEHFETALQVYEACRADAALRGEQRSVAFQLNNMAGVYVQLGDLAAARSYASRAAELYAALDMGNEGWGPSMVLGRIAVRERGIAGMSVLEEAASELERQGLRGEWVFVRVALAEELLRMDPGADVSRYCWEAYHRAISLGMETMAAEALRLLDGCGHGEARQSLPS